MKALIAVWLGFAAAHAQGGRVAVAIETELGSIEAEIALDKAPISGTNFLKYVDAGLYTNAFFPRTARAHSANRSQKGMMV